MNLKATSSKAQETICVKGQTISVVDRSIDEILEDATEAKNTYWINNPTKVEVVTESGKVVQGYLKADIENVLTVVNNYEQACHEQDVLTYLEENIDEYTNEQVCMILERMEQIATSVYNRLDNSGEWTYAMAYEFQLRINK